MIFIVNISTATLLVLARAWQRVVSQEAGSLNVSFSPSNVSQVTRFCHFCHKIRFSSLTEMKIGTSWGCGCALTSENCWIGEQTPSYICKARGPSGLLYTLSKEAFIRSFSQHCRDWCNSLSKFKWWMKFWLHVFILQSGADLGDCGGSAQWEYRWDLNAARTWRHKIVAWLAFSEGFKKLLL